MTPRDDHTNYDAEKENAAQVNDRLAKAMGWDVQGSCGASVLCFFEKESEDNDGLYNFAKSRDDLALVEAEIERRGLIDKYLDALAASYYVAHQDEPVEKIVYGCSIFLRTCPPAVAAPIALKVLEGGAK